MPKNKDFKRLVRQRAAVTGESYSTARAQLLRRHVHAAAGPVVCAITGAAGRVAYNAIFAAASGQTFGPDTPVVLHLHDLDEALPALEGTVMELEDCSFPLLAGVDVTSDYEAAFDAASWLLLLGAPRRRAGMERRDLLAATSASFVAQGRAVQKTAAADVRIVVVGNPANTNCLVARTAAPEVPEDRWLAMLRLDHNRTRSTLAERAGVPLSSVRNVAVWGNHSATMVPDVWHATIDDRPAADIVGTAWIVDELVPTVQQRGATLIEVSGASSAASAAAALADSVRDVTQPPASREWTTAGVVSHGEYGVPVGLQFGFPVRFAADGPAIVEGLHIDHAQRRLLDLTVAELEDERALATRLAQQ